MTTDIPDLLDELIAEAMRFERPLTVNGNACHGWWTGTLSSGEQLVAAPWAEEIFLARFDSSGDGLRWPDWHRRLAMALLQCAAPIP